jgi:Na+-transporting methylmalonyl-CoA/oxaloacetate decarboxylase beta subunit
MNPFPLIKLIFVMCLIPTILNSLTYWIFDNLLKKSTFSLDEELIEESFSDISINELIDNHIN